LKGIEEEKGEPDRLRLGATHRLPPMYRKKKGKKGKRHQGRTLYALCVAVLPEKSKKKGTASGLTRQSHRESPPSSTRGLFTHKRKDREKKKKGEEGEQMDAGIG